MIACPFCDGNGAIHQAKIKNTNKIIYICNECDTIWHTREVKEENCDNFQTYMLEEFGLTATWDNLQDIKLL